MFATLDTAVGVELDDAASPAALGFDWVPVGVGPWVAGELGDDDAPEAFGVVVFGVLGVDEVLVGPGCAAGD